MKGGISVTMEELNRLSYLVKEGPEDLEGGEEAKGSQEKETRRKGEGSRVDPKTRIHAKGNCPLGICMKARSILRLLFPGIYAFDRLKQWVRREGVSILAFTTELGETAEFARNKNSLGEQLYMYVCVGVDMCLHVCV